MPSTPANHNLAVEHCIYAKRRRRPSAVENDTVDQDIPSIAFEFAV
jgi:hypothetical protein